MTKQIHLGWFLSGGFGPKGWRSSFGGPNPERWGEGGLIIDLARALERASFDYLMLEDSANVPYTHRASHDAYLKYGIATPKLEPSTLAASVFRETTRLGVITTLSTSEHHPYQVARITNTLDHLSAGRAGWNIVTGSNDGGAQNFGEDRHLPHDTRYDRADEFTEVVTRLWDSWDEDAVVIDRDAETFAIGDRVHPIHHEGEWFRSRGPLNGPRSPQGRPVICQAGGSPRGTRFAARWAETIVGSARSAEKAREFRENVRRSAADQGRDPDEIKVLFTISPIVDETEGLARTRHDLAVERNAEHVEEKLATLARTSGIDFSGYDLDEVLPELESNGHRTLVAQYTGKTLRELVARGGWEVGGLDLVGTPERVARNLAAFVDETGADGFLLASGDLTRRYVAEITDGLVPELQRLGVTRSRYTGGTLREHLREF